MVTTISLKSDHVPVKPHPKTMRQPRMDACGKLPVRVRAQYWAPFLQAKWGRADWPLSHRWRASTRVQFQQVIEVDIVTSLDVCRCQ
jgi:hypothetical protein